MNLVIVPRYENTPLHTAALSGPLLLVQTLVNEKAQLTATNKKGQTALDVARDPDIIEFLQKGLFDTT